MAIDKSLEAILTQDDFQMSPEGLMVVEQEEEPTGDTLLTEMDNLIPIEVVDLIGKKPTNRD